MLEGLKRHQVALAADNSLKSLNAFQQASACKADQVVYTKIGMSICQETWDDLLSEMDKAFGRLQAQVPAPRQQLIHGITAFRYSERMVQQALLQKLARQISGLRAVQILHLAEFYQEQGVLQRTLDELGDDIVFLTLALTNDTVTPLHQQYLEAFWQEEFEGEDAVSSTQARVFPQRKKIRAYLNRLSGLPDPSRANEVGRTLHKMYSGYVHAASPHIMDMCWGDPPRFQLRGMTGTPIEDVHSGDLANYLYRGLMAVTFVAKAFGDGVLVEKLYSLIPRAEGQLNV